MSPALSKPIRVLLSSLAKEWVEVGVPSGKADHQETHQQRAKFQKHLTDVILSENLVVLTGLGTSMGLNSEGGKKLAPSMSDLWQAAKEKAGDHFTGVNEAVGYTPASGKENIEHLLSRCQMSERLKPNPLVERFIIDTERIIVSMCRFVNDELPLKTHEAFLRRIARRSTRLPRLKLFTTNYDLCFEVAASRTRFVVIDGFSQAMPQEFDGSYFGYDLVKRRDDKETPDYVANVFQLYKLHGSVEWANAGDQVRKFPTPDNPLLIYPRESKFELSYDQPFLELMSRFQMALRQTNTGLLIIGFGFNDQHIAQPVLSAMKSNVSLKAMVVSPNLTDTDNSVIREISALIREGDPRIGLLATTFEELVPEIPDLVTATEEERHLERLRNLKAAQ